MEPQNSSPKGNHTGKWDVVKIWGGIMAALGGITIIIDIPTKSVGIVCLLFPQTCEPTPVVTLIPGEKIDKVSCLEFAFSNLPSGFALSKIYLDIIKAPEIFVPESYEPESFAPESFMLRPFSSKSHTEIVSMTFSSLQELREGKQIRCPVNFQARIEDEVIYTYFCPVHTIPSPVHTIPTYVIDLHVVPSFILPNNSQFQEIMIRAGDGSDVNEGVKISVSHRSGFRVFHDPLDEVMSKCELK